MNCKSNNLVCRSIITRF